MILDSIATNVGEAEGAISLSNSYRRSMRIARRGIVHVVVAVRMALENAKLNMFWEGWEGLAGGHISLFYTLKSMGI